MIRKKTIRLVARAWLVIAPLGVISHPAHAGEGGSSHYNPATPGDFAMALIGPAGFYLRNDLFYFDGDIGPVTLGNSLMADASQQTWVDIVKGVYLAPSGVLGGRLGAVVSVPIVINAKVSGTLEAPPDEREGSSGGFSDIALTGLSNWSRGNKHTSVGISIYAATGSYDKGKIINLGRNYWSFDPVVSFTWLDPKRGHEVSFVAGAMFNTENDATDYQTGSEFHLDFNIAQHFSATFAVGVVGYYYDQMTADEGALVDQLNAIGKASKGLQGQASGIGPAVMWTHAISGRDVTFIGKWMHDMNATNRFEGDRVFLCAALAVHRKTPPSSTE